MQQSDYLIERIGCLPSLPPVLARITAVVSRNDVSISEIADVIRLDPGIAGKVLRLSNSAYIGIPRTVSSLTNAVVILGQRRIQSLVFASATLAALGRVQRLPFKNIDFWRHSITTALVCESIARHLKRYDSVDSGELFCAGILHDIGKLAIGMFDAARLEAAYSLSQQGSVAFFKVEQTDTSHFTIGALMAQRWSFPPDLRNAILYHHDPAGAEPFMKVAAIVHLSDAMAHIMGFRTFAGEIAPQIDEQAVSCIELQPERLRVIAGAAVEDEKKIESLIDFIL